jgi:preflagellin peptidase FlaK
MFLGSLRLVITFAFLLYASWSDLKTHEVSNNVWIFFGPVAFVLALMDSLRAPLLGSLTSFGASLIVISVLAIALFYLGFFGGADAKALICLSLAFPTYPNEIFPSLGYVLPIFVMSVFNNAVVLSALVALGILIMNVKWKLKTGRDFFRGLETEPLYKRILVLVTGLKIKITELEKKPHYYPIESIEELPDGKFRRRLQIFVRVIESNDKMSADKFKEFVAQGKLSDEIWATPVMPFLVFITLGFAATLVFGDILLSLVFRLLSLF